MPIYGIVAQELFIAPPPPPGNPARFISVGTDVGQSVPILFTTEDNDAATWVDRSAAAVLAAPEAVLQCVAYSPSLDRWVAGGYASGNIALAFGTPQIIYSDDGGNSWAQGTPAPSTDFFIIGICWTGSAFIAVGNDSAISDPRVMTSADGITWTARTSAPTTNALWLAVSGYSGLAIAVGSTGDSSVTKIMTSANEGASWTARTPDSVPNPLNGIVAVSGGTHVGVGFQAVATTIETSTNATTWTQRVGASDTQPYSVAYNGSIYVAVGWDSGSGVEARIMTATNPTSTWTARTPDPAGAVPAFGFDGPNLLSVVAGASGGFVAVGRDNNAWDRSYTMYSADGITWVARNAANSLVGPLFGVGAMP